MRNAEIFSREHRRVKGRVYADPYARDWSIDSRFGSIDWLIADLFLCSWLPYQVVEDLEQLSNDEDLVKRIVEEENQRERRTKKKVANTKGMQD